MRRHLANQKNHSSFSKLHCLEKDCVLQWMPAHVGIDGNETADQLAKDVGLLNKSLTIADLRLGESICHSLLDYYCAIKYIPPEDVPKAVRESCCKGSRAKMVSNGNNRSPHRAASNTALNEKKAGPQPTTSKNKTAKTKAVASKQSNEQKHSSNQKAVAAKNI
ncbi:hypothetical protein AVEN_262529-1 [Araneus ventricosus]|uniref:RNase H type-1 domain-containing protein n=1 Tax=Araneus ventricosus TaxID=182803 RepID=A0A4Y2HYK9_ARAVE|nr:hypothetical protein AVEN_262529-1 [Araneus ventricosus]